MALTLPNGSSLALGTNYGSSKVMSAVSNAAQAVATLEASHGVVANDVILVSSGWDGLDGRVVRAKSVSTNDVTLDEIDTSSLTKYPAGSGVGTIKEVTAWTPITQILEFATEGGDQEFWAYQFLESRTRRQVPTVQSPIAINVVLGDDQSKPWYEALDAAHDAGTIQALRLTLPSGAIIYYGVYVSFQRTPTLVANQGMSVRASFALVGDVTRYAS